MKQFSSRPPFNDDPKPLVHPSGKRTPAFSYHFEFEPGESGPFGRVAQASYSPRPEYNRLQHNPANPILVELRAEQLATDRPLNYWLEVQLLRFQRDDPDTYEHARRVLTRLAGIEAKRGS